MGSPLFVTPSAAADDACDVRQGSPPRGSPLFVNPKRGCGGRVSVYRYASSPRD